jgi:hypothetical protein
MQGYRRLRARERPVVLPRRALAELVNGLDQVEHGLNDKCADANSHCYGTGSGDPSLPKRQVVGQIENHGRYSARGNHNNGRHGLT